MFKNIAAVIVPRKGIYKCRSVLFMQSDFILYFPLIFIKFFDGVETMLSAFRNAEMFYICNLFALPYTKIRSIRFFDFKIWYGYISS